MSLTDGGGWRFHSWGSLNDGTIVETTVKALAYITYDPYKIKMTKTFTHKYKKDEVFIMYNYQEQVKKVLADMESDDESSDA